MTFEPLSSDFYGFEAALTDQEKDSLMELRAWLDAEVRPYANDLWAKAEFLAEDKRYAEAVETGRKAWIEAAKDQGLSGQIPTLDKQLKAWETKAKKK